MNRETDDGARFGLPQLVQMAAQVDALDFDPVAVARRENDRLSEFLHEMGVIDAPMPERSAAYALGEMALGVPLDEYEACKLYPKLQDYLDWLRKQGIMPDVKVQLRIEVRLQ